MSTAVCFYKYCQFVQIRALSQSLVNTIVWFYMYCQLFLKYGAFNLGLKLGQTHAQFDIMSQPMSSLSQTLSHRSFVLCVGSTTFCQMLSHFVVCRKTYLGSVLSYFFVISIECYLILDFVMQCVIAVCAVTHTLATIAFQILSHTQCQLSTFRQGKQYFSCMLLCVVGRQLRQMFFTVCHKPFRELSLLQVPQKLWQGNWYSHSCSRTMNVLSHIVSNIGLCFMRV